MSLARELGLTEREAAAAFGAIRAVVEAQGEPGPNGARLLEVAASALDLGPAFYALAPASAAEVAAAFPSAAARRALVDALLIPAAIEGEVTTAGVALVRSFARLLGVTSHWVTLLVAMSRRNVFAIKRQLVRRSPDARRLFARIWAEEGLVGIGRALLFVLGVYRDAALAARFRALGALPEGTFGRQFFDHIVSRGLAFPGERGGLPERMLHHDLMHIVNGYGTDAAGECELAGFYAGFCPGDSFTFVVTVLTTFHLGLPVSPAIVEPARGAFDPARVLAAFLRGRRLAVDVMGAWDYWALMPLPLELVRERLGIAAAGASDDAGAQEAKGLVDLVVGEVRRGPEAQDVASRIGEDAVLPELGG